MEHKPALTMESINRTAYLRQQIAILTCFTINNGYAICDICGNRFSTNQNTETKMLMHYKLHLEANQS